MQTEILDRSPKAELRVFAVWFSVLPGDARERWLPAILADPRVVNYWDASGDVGRWFSRHVTRRPDADFEWDAYFLYPREARWEAVPAPLASWGTTVLASRDELGARALPLLGAPASAPAGPRRD
ncbi:MAG TPA: hypothetical protein VHR45_20205 [Thermoanaerobaculia bacterium]|nr:hypothetical protein [Thermoanaerobaculia bacterium]